MDDLSEFLMTRPPSVERPLLGLTVLVVEDSRFACEAVRLLCLRSGARIRRADSLAAARRHLRVYRPSVVIVDMGLPDGSGGELIAELRQAQPRVSVILGTSGDAASETDAVRAGVDGFLAKPVASLAAFQEAVLCHLPAEAQPPGPRLLQDTKITPDPVAFRDDMAHAADMLDDNADERVLDYVAQFLGGVAKSAEDGDLLAAAAALAGRRDAGGPSRRHIAHIAGLVQDRLGGREAV